MGLGCLHISLRRSHLATALTCVAAAGALAACGGDDDSSSTNAAKAPTESSSTAPASNGSKDERQESGPTLGGDKEEARAGVDAVEGVYEGFSAAVDEGLAAVDVPARQTLESAQSDEGLAGVCDLMSEDAKRQTIVYAKRSSGLADVEWTCENATGLLLRRARAAGALKRTIGAKVVGVNVDGDRATASVRFGRRLTSIPLVKEGGKWRLAASASDGGDGG